MTAHLPSWCHIVVLLSFLFKTHCQAALVTSTASIVDVTVLQGAISTDQDISVLATKDLSGVVDGWDDYIELGAANNRRGFRIQFDFQLGSLQGTLQEISVQANAQGSTFRRQKLTYLILNVAQNGWELLGNNRDASSWIWHYHAFGPILNPGNYINNQNLISIRLESSNDYDVVNLDFLQVQVQAEVPNTPPPTTAPPTKAPTPPPTTPPPTSTPPVSDGVLLEEKLAGDLPAIDTSVTAGNPLKGFLTSPNWVPYSQQDKGIPSSLDYYYIGWDTTMTGMTTFDWSTLEGYLAQSATQNRHAIVRFMLDYPNQPSYIPQFLIDAGLQITDYDSVLGTGKSPDYSSQLLLDALSNFIAAFGQEYDGDPRLGFVQLGLLGHWGEWHTYPEPDWIPESTQIAVAGWFDAAFSMTPLQGRYPRGSSIVARGMGLHDDSFTHSTLSSSIGWFFWPGVESTGYTDFWKTAVMGGEVRPENQNIVFSSGFGSGDYEQDFGLCVNTTHATYMLLNYAFCCGYSADDLVRAQAGAIQMGYQFEVARVATYSAPELTVDVEVDIKQSGVAPFYYPLSLKLACASGEWVMGDVDVLVDRGTSKTFRFSGIPSDLSCLQSLVISLDSDYVYSGRPVNLAQGNGAVSVAFSNSSA